MSTFGVLRGLFRARGKVHREALRGNLSAKDGDRLFYKGSRTGSVGWNTRRGGYQVDPARLPKLNIPDLTNCELKAYVAHGTPKVANVPELAYPVIVKDWPSQS
eukprot:TRINITY_DN11813_c0_g1_i1.p1 TRINITY_DN11813_c0_g1~~TRINITY_DN11813_c0_g1_i1.p1  ORF type:complete len:104 (-),score=19.18 TRINITY_DN11813_c0_g1_i1:197-508(-)